MKITKALDEVGKRYVPGTVAYYARQRPDPWQAAHDLLERAIKLGDRDLEELACDRFVERASELIQAFQATGRESTRVSPADAFAMGNETRVRRYLSLKTRSCAFCDSREKVAIGNHNVDELGIYLICAECKARGTDELVR